MIGIGSGITTTLRAAPPKGEENMEQPGSATGQEASPEEQAAMDKFVDNAVKLMSDPQSGKLAPAVEAQLQGQFDLEIMQMFADVKPPHNPQSPIDNVAFTGLIIVMATDASAHENGFQMGNDVVLNAGVDVIDILVDEAKRMGLVEGTDEDVQNAFTRAVDVYQQIDGPRVDKQALAAEFEELVQADREGRLEEVLPGASQFAGAADEGQQQPQQQERMA